MMKRNSLGTTVVVSCDADGCGLCWLYDAPAGATFKAARQAAVRAGWTILRGPAARLDLCRYCAAARMQETGAVAAWARRNAPHGGRCIREQDQA